MCASAIKTASKVQWPLRFAFSYVQPITQHYRRKTVEVPLQQSSHHENMIRTPLTINYYLGAAAIMLHFQLCSARYTVLNSVRKSSLQSVQSPRKIWTILIYIATVGKPCITLL